MKPWDVLRSLTAIALGLGLGSSPSQAADRPNILLILADDMGYADTSPYGSEIFTPNIARLAARA